VYQEDVAGTHDERINAVFVFRLGPLSGPGRTRTYDLGMQSDRPFDRYGLQPRDVRRTGLLATSTPKASLATHSLATPVQ
jgi:hypothetical protein